MKTHAVELMLAALMVACGFILLWPGETFLLPHYTIMKTWISESLGGIFLSCIGAIRIWAILRNGGYRYSPLWRIGGCAIGAGFWLTLLLSIWLDVTSDHFLKLDLGLPLLLGVAAVAFGFEMYSAMRGGADASTLDSFRIKENRMRMADPDADIP